MNEDLDIPVRTYRAEGRARDDRRMIFVAGGIAAALVVAVGGVALLRGGGHAPRTIPVIAADPRPVRVKPTDPGGMQVAGQGEDILSGGTDAGDATVLAPPPEAPDLRGLGARRAEAQAAPKETPDAPPASPPIPPAVQTPAVAAQPAPAVAAKAAPAAPVAATGPEVRLGALDSEALAAAEIARITKRAPDALAGRAVRTERIARDGKVFWLLRAGPFPDIAGATAFCGKLRAKAVTCALAG